MRYEYGLNWPLGLLAVSVIIAVMCAGFYDYAYAQEPEPKTEANYYRTEDVLKFSTNLEVAAPPGMEDFYDKDYYGEPLIYCANGYDFDIWIVTRDGAVTVPAKGHFVLTKKGE
jgi:hypothetical protein